MPVPLSVLLGVSARKPAAVIGGARVRGSFHARLALGRELKIPQSKASSGCPVPTACGAGSATALSSG